MKRHPLTVMLVSIVLICFMEGCASTRSRTEHDSTLSERNQIRNQAYSLFFKLMNDEKNVSRLLVIKNETSALHEIVEKIAKTASRVVAQMEQFQKQDPSIALNLKPLPGAEVKARGIIRSTRAKEFELKLALSQAEALSYASAISQTITELDHNPTRKSYFNKISREFHALHQEIFAFILNNK